MTKNAASDLSFRNCGLNSNCRRMQIITEQLNIGGGDFENVSNPLVRALAVFFNQIFREFEQQVSF